ncbi:FKBP-type peptidyl-prolyl cis-trans isomerase [Flavobacterium sp. 14A]|uniref:FKBP-type peptidyl-prolyl cis-trans isomerase n=1 Tax=Flavobacterium sp. 14A TaxID=2735896 RepID=UPI001570957D|nr:FKBP-type peptidylprolyl isomerase [Flavobacterium sp. 14A]NRT11159.1 hypothetical protein [Flavobacterium sp. 14A]
MNKFKYYFILSITTLSLFSCSKSDDTIELTPPREYSVQYPTDLTDIEEYLTSNYITVTNHPGFTDDQDVTITKIPTGGTQPSIMSYLNKSTFPKLLVREVKLHDLTYKLYYLALREGAGDRPTNVDAVLTSYKGVYLSRVTGTDAVSTLTTTDFEEQIFPQSTLSLYTAIRGWKEVFPQFRIGTSKGNADGTVSYNDFGAGMIFIPSGLAYFSQSTGIIPSYAPLVFSFKLYGLVRSDLEIKNVGVNIFSDPDGVLSYLEDIDGDGYLWRADELPTDAVNPDDSDGDGVPDFLDVDDDGDGFTTKAELAAGTNYLDKNSHP